MSNQQITAGTIAIAKVGRNDVEVTVLEKLETGWKVRSNRSGREFQVRAIERGMNIPSVGATSEEAGNGTADSPSEPVIRSDAGKLSLLGAAARVLEESRTPMNCREIIAKAVAAELWIPSAAKTPEQSLYSAIFREISGKEHPRFRKSAERKGAFEYNR